ncbi:alpha-D-ribose 1-methylphosphonate 5-triphosphate diphosphatase [Oceanisphaera arctica]|uniref:Phosphonate metabolism protein PhnM n=1 Tax=Oceanisphaera arctica TaxID=641510 RepID=A0A2P5TNR8_9GAMM|nr:alpha-D-ribose 1-methylphosphonate 5-triphosphate diphosphatase [Oceanisphaera arctica]PPL17231.1 phosphonate metabolism protein PhnM [Oceanisphaera arctica]GHA20410.1 phosphonate metabolism protein PhnM [Oceanisphaera arctica]
MIITNVKLVLENEVVAGSVEIGDGKIRALADGPSRQPGAVDGQGGWLLPGLVELHTDNLDKHFTPRPKVSWPPFAAMRAHDAQVVSAGITTVLDAVAIGDERDGGTRQDNLDRMIHTVVDSERRGLNRAQHLLHLRCELPHETTVPLFEHYLELPEVRLVSLMDHSPGQRQFVNMVKYREYYQGKYHLNDQQMLEFEQSQLALSARWSAPNRAEIARQCLERGLSLASHDDATLEHVQESRQLGMVIAEFPTTVEAATASHRHDLMVMMGAPNVVRGGSHSGNVAAHELAALGVLDVLSSDYYPGSLLDAVFRLAEDDRNALGLADAVRLATCNPARALGLSDRGVLAEGRRADLVLARQHDGQVYPTRVWCRGELAY